MIPPSYRDSNICSSVFLKYTVVESIEQMFENKCLRTRSRKFVWKFPILRQGVPNLGAESMAESGVSGRTWLLAGTLAHVLLAHVRLRAWQQR